MPGKSKRVYGYVTIFFKKKKNEPNYYFCLLKENEKILTIIYTNERGEYLA